MDNKIDLLSKIIEEEIETLRNNAAYGGEHGDRGAYLLEERLKFYRYGLANVWPLEWSKYKTQLAEKIDPDFQKYLELKEQMKAKG